MEKLTVLKAFAEKELFNNILPYWRNIAPDNEQGGFYGSISNELVVDKYAPKGLILNARLLYTFSAAYQLTNKKEDYLLAERAYNYICKYFHDKEHGGYFWTVKAAGSVDDPKKQTYGQAFVIYGMSEFYKITGEKEALEHAKELFYIMEEKTSDGESNGYYEAFSKDWKVIDDVRLSSKDMNEQKTMNTHLHIMEAYANLLPIWNDILLKKKLVNLIQIFEEHIISNRDYHLNLFFDEKWNLKSSEISYGHDIEAAWLIHEAALAVGDKALIQRIQEIVPRITNSALEGLTPLGGLIHEGDRNKKHTDNEFEWWPQAETLVGLLDTYELSSNKEFLNYTEKISEFIQKYVVDHENGEWFYRVGENLKPLLNYEKTGLWKCPYHNGRACIEIIKRVDKLKNKKKNESMLKMLLSVVF